MGARTSDEVQGASGLSSCIMRTFRRSQDLVADRKNSLEMERDDWNSMTTTYKNKDGLKRLTLSDYLTD